MKQIKIRNFSTGVGVSQTIAEIEKILLAIGAESIVKQYHGDSRVKSIAFQIQINEEKKGFMLPANVENVITIFKIYQAEWHLPKDEFKLKEQAERVAWRIIKDWLHAQLSLIQVGQAQPEQIFLPYMWDGKRTLYEALKERNFNLALPERER